MIKIQVLGHGLIPRGNGIAPRKDPILADRDLIKLILNSGSLKAIAINPKNGALIPLNFKNLNRVYTAFDDANNKTDEHVEEKTVEVASKSSIPEKKFDQKKATPKPESRSTETKDEPSVATVKLPDPSLLQTIKVETTADDVSSYSGNVDRTDKPKENKDGKGNKDTLKVLNNPNA